jgi:hypothetical protein
MLRPGTLQSRATVTVMATVTVSGLLLVDNDGFGIVIVRK